MQLMQNDTAVKTERQSSKGNMNWLGVAWPV